MQCVITQLRVQFARHGIPGVLIMDNGSEFDNQEFKTFSSQWQFEYRTSCPRYPQSNGKVENAVKTCKGLLVKAKKDKKDPLLATLDWRNTPQQVSLPLGKDCITGSTTEASRTSPLESRGCHPYIVGEELEPRSLFTPSGPTVLRS